jgi:hypothetical protein
MTTNNYVSMKDPIYYVCLVGAFALGAAIDTPVVVAYVGLALLTAAIVCFAYHNAQQP